MTLKQRYRSYMKKLARRNELSRSKRLQKARIDTYLSHVRAAISRPNRSDRRRYCREHGVLWMHVPKISKEVNDKRTKNLTPLYTSWRGMKDAKEMAVIKRRKAA